MKESLFIASSWLHIYNYLKVVQDRKYKKNNILIIESHNLLSESFNLINLLCKEFNLNLVYVIKNKEFGGLKGLINQKFNLFSRIKSLINLENLDFYTSNDKYFLVQLLMNECMNCNFNYIEEGTEIYNDIFASEKFYKIFIKKFLFPKYESLLYLGSHSLIENVYVSTINPFREILEEKFVKKGKILKRIPVWLNKSFVKCICNTLCDDFIIDDYSAILILTNTEIILNKEKYIEFYIRKLNSLRKKYGISTIFIKFHPREKDYIFKNLFIKEIKNFFINVEIISDMIPLEILIDYLVEINKKFYIMGDFSSAILLSFIFKKGKVFPYLPQLCFSRIINCNFKSKYIQNVLKLYSFKQI